MAGAVSGTIVPGDIEKGLSAMPVKMDDVDANLISLLQVDGRLSNIELARQLGIAEATVRKHLKGLLAEEIVQISAWADPLKLGYQLYALIMIRADPPMLEKAAEKVAGLPELFFVGLATGAFDIFATGLFRSNAHLDEFFTKRLSHIPGIVSMTTYNIMRIVKRDYRYPVVLKNADAAAGMRQRVRTGRK